MKEKIPGVYSIENTVNGKLYIGSAQDIHYRRRKHIERLRADSHANEHLQYAWNKYSESAFVFTVLEVTRIDDLLTREQTWIDELGVCDRSKGYNIALYAGAPMRGRKASEDTKAKLAKNWKGRKHTPESIEKMREIHKGKQYCLGRKLSPEHKARLSESNRTRGTTDQKREKLRQANLGKKHSEETRAKMREIMASRARNPNGTLKSER
jgi:group I intron endonuclease